VRTWFAFEGAAPLAGEPEAAARWVARGVRLFGLVHSRDNVLAGSSSQAAEERRGGLTAEGKRLVSAVHRAGGVVDVSHASDAALDDILAMAVADGVPVVASHSNARALVPHPRNVTDEQARAIGKTGGVVGVAFHSTFLVQRGRARLSDVVRHVRHLVDVAGVDHVAIGSDFEGDIMPPRELRDVSGFPRLAGALREAGMAPGDVAKVLGANALRVLCPERAKPFRH
jgi:membrane dipeptidase